MRLHITMKWVVYTYLTPAVVQTEEAETDLILKSDKYSDLTQFLFANNSHKLHS